MKEKDAYAELASIRNLMERSSKFISLSGLSGILVGLYALAGIWFAIRITTNHTEIGAPAENIPVITQALSVVSLVVLILSAVTAYLLTRRKANRRNENVWNPVSRRLLAASAVPFLTGGIFIIIMAVKGSYSFIAPATLIFYGLALVAGSEFTYNDVKWLGFGEIILGLLALVMPEWGLIFWAIGFGLLHIIYGIIMHFKYER